MSDDLRESLAARRFFADRLEAYFKQHPRVWIGLPELMKIGGPSWRSRIFNDLRNKRHMRVVWNRSNLESAYMFTEHEPLGRDASIPVPDQWPVFDAPSQEPWSLK